VVLLCVGGTVVVATWIAWILRIGRFKPADGGQRISPEQAPLSFIIADAAVKLVNDFRHLLALLLVLIYGGTLAWVLEASDTPDHMWEGLKTVTATLGGVVASIIGYYFGEARTSTNPKVPTGGRSDQAEQGPPTPASLTEGAVVPVTRPVAPTAEDDPVKK